MYRLFRQGCDVSLSKLPFGSSLTNFSLLNDVSEPVVFRSFSIKYVLDGCERYTVNGSRYDVCSGMYLLANASCSGRVSIDSPTLVKGLCIDIAPDLLSEAFAAHLQPGTAMPDISLDDFFTRDAFPENCYRGTRTRLGALLGSAGEQLSRNPQAGHDLDESFYFDLAAAIVADHEPVISGLYSIGTAKHATRKELYRKVCRGKDFIDENWDKRILIAEAASYATLSEYYFYRLFRAVFGSSPQQYLLQRRLGQAKKLLLRGGRSVTDIALEVGFTDAAGFSKAFRKHYGLPPSYHI